MKGPIKLLKRSGRRFYKSIFKNPGFKIKSFLNNKGDKHKCYICGNTFNEFIKYHGGKKNIPEFRIKLELVDSDRDNFQCPNCPAYDRERHLFMYFDKLNFWEKISLSHILHFAPEINLSKKITNLKPINYIKADFKPSQKDIKKIDATNIPFEANTFDLIICNHVLEHIPNYLVAISEIYRVLKPEGIAILQTPYSKLLSKNFEDKNIDTDQLRFFFYGEKDHYRIFAEQHFFQDLRNAGFNLKIVQHEKFFDKDTTYYYGVSANEDLIQVIKKN